MFTRVECLVSTMVLEPHSVEWFCLLDEILRVSVTLPLSSTVHLVHILLICSYDYEIDCSFHTHGSQSLSSIGFYTFIATDVLHNLH